MSILNDLIQITKDSEEGFCTAAENVTDVSLKEAFIKKAQNCNRIASKFQQKVVEMNGDPEEKGSFLGAMHRGWMNIKSAFTRKDDHSILVECERSEDAIKVAYSKALNSNLPIDLHSLIEEKYEDALKDNDLIRDLRDRYTANQ